MEAGREGESGRERPGGSGRRREAMRGEGTTMRGAGREVEAGREGKPGRERQGGPGRRREAMRGEGIREGGAWCLGRMSREVWPDCFMR